jgi:hypothetical protein
MSTAGGSGAAHDATVVVEEHQEAVDYAAQQEALLVLAEDAERAADGAEAKVEKQQQHLADAKANAKLLRAEATKARKAADKAMGDERDGVV